MLMDVNKEGPKACLYAGRKRAQLSGKWDEEYIFMVHLKFIPF